MLSHEDNETLVRVGRGTPMGDFLRLFWVPFLPSSDPAVDGRPQRVRLFGEDLVAFRDSEARRTRRFCTLALTTKARSTNGLRRRICVLYSSANVANSA